MKKHMLNKYTISFTLLLFLAFSAMSCGGGSDDEFTDIPDDIGNVKQTVVDESAMNEVISSFSSPVEMAALMQSIDVPFSKKFLIDPEITEDYDTNYKKALALGILSADLGYLNVYGRTTLIVEYLTAIKKIADDLNIGQFFDFQSLKQIATGGGDVDSLLFLSVTSFHDMDEHLRQNARSNLSLLVVTGVWLEGLYLLTQVAVENPTPKLKERVGEQKTLFNYLYPLLKLYKEEKFFEDISDDFEDFQKIFDEIEIVYHEGDVITTVDENGNVTFEQEAYSEVKISDEQLQDIIKTTEKVRNKLINL